MEPTVSDKLNKVLFEPLQTVTPPLNVPTKVVGLAVITKLSEVTESHPPVNTTL